MRLRKLAVSVGSSLWFVPVMCVLAGVAISFGTIALDRAFEYHAIPQSLVGRPTSATAILNTIAVSMVSLAALVLTITMVVVQLAMGQFSPRIVQRILRDKPSQLAIGLFVATFVHAVLTIREVVDRGDGTGQVPGIAVATSYLLVLASIAALVIYVHHIGQSLRVSALIELVGNDTRKLVDRRYPDAGQPPPVDPEAPRVVAARESGVVTMIGTHALVAEAERADCVLELVPALGGFVPAGGPLFIVHGDPDGLDENRLFAALSLKLEPTLDEDVAYGMRLLVDIAERSLSESPFQDPTTAVQAIDRLHDILRQLARRPFPDGRVHDEARRGPTAREDDELGGLRSPGLRRDPDGRRRLATGLPTPCRRLDGSPSRRAFRSASRCSTSSLGCSVPRRLRPWTTSGTFAGRSIRTAKD